MHRTRVNFLEVLTEVEGEGQEGSNAPLTFQKIFLPLKKFHLMPWLPTLSHLSGGKLFPG
jgi:hypothetical protein